MIDSLSKQILNRKPNIRFIKPKSLDTIPIPSPAKPVTEKAQKIDQLIKGFKNLDIAAAAVEDLIAARAKDVELDLDLNAPEDFVVAQASARLFPDLAEELMPGVMVVKKITFDMYKQSMQQLKAHGKQVGQQNQMPAVNPSLSKTDFGGLGKDRRPEVNKMSMIMPPVPIPAYLITTIPLLFMMLHPLRMAYTNSKIAGHIHNIIAPSPATPVGPGIPVNPA